MGTVAPEAPITVIKPTAANLETAVGFLIQEYSAGRLTVDQYRGGLVVLAWDFLQIGALAEGLGMLRSMPATWFTDVLPQMAAENNMLAIAATNMAEWLERGGHIDPPEHGPEFPADGRYGRA